MTTHRTGVFSLFIEPSRVDKIAERLMPVQHLKMLLPFGCIVFGIRSEFHATPTDAGRRIVTKSTNSVRQIGKTMLLISFPEPIGRGQRKATKTRLAVFKLQGSLLKPAELHRKGAEQDDETDDSVEGAERD